MSRRPPWLTEEQICDLIEANASEVLYIDDEDAQRVVREFDLNGFRPDFVIFNRNPRSITVVEVKVTADIWAVDQCAKYVRLMRENAMFADYEVEVLGEVWARCIDESVWNTAYAARIGLQRITVEEDGKVSLQIEPYPLLRGEPTKNVCEYLLGISGGPWPA